MLDGLKRWLQGSPAAGTEGFEGVAAWASGSQYTFRSVLEDGFVIDGKLGSSVWRMEWGPSQRPYINGHELRLRAEPGVEGELQLLVLTRDLQEQLEKSIFEQYVEDVQTRIDHQTPPEMRWLVMFPKLAGNEMGGLRDAYVGLGNAKPWLQAWLRGGLSQALQTRAAESSGPLLLMIGRGRLMLRTALDIPTVGELKRCLTLFEVALREARRVHNENPVGSDWGPPSGVADSAVGDTKT
jgi:hypothetical protein